MQALEDDNGEGASTLARPGTGLDSTGDNFQDALIEDAALLDEEDYLADVNIDA